MSGGGSHALATRLCCGVSLFVAVSPCLSRCLPVCRGVSPRHLESSVGLL